MTDYLPIGNGYLAGAVIFIRSVDCYSYHIAMTPGGTTYEETQLNIESLWSGGPFADPVSDPSEMSTYILAGLLIIWLTIITHIDLQRW